MAPKLVKIGTKRGEKDKNQGKKAQKSYYFLNLAFLATVQLHQIVILMIIRHIMIKQHTFCTNYDFWLIFGGPKFNFGDFCWFFYIFGSLDPQKWAKKSKNFKILTSLLQSIIKQWYTPNFNFPSVVDSPKVPLLCENLPKKMLKITKYGFWPVLAAIFDKNI